jgi:hypothetical protein
MKNVQIDLVSYSSISKWTPSIGDVLFKEGFFSRWCGTVSGINGYKINLSRAGNIHLLLTDEVNNFVINLNKIKHARFGIYYVISNGTYYI